MGIPDLDPDLSVSSYLHWADTHSTPGDEI